MVVELKKTIRVSQATKTWPGTNICHLAPDLYAVKIDLSISFSPLISASQVIFRYPRRETRLSEL